MKVRSALAGAVLGVALSFLAAPFASAADTASGPVPAPGAAAQPAPPAAQQGAPTAQPAPPFTKPAHPTETTVQRPAPSAKPAPISEATTTPAAPTRAPGQVVVKPKGAAETGAGGTESESGVPVGLVGLGGGVLVVGAAGALVYRRRANR